jgi:Tat protein secretion system quality control protein TatD with DNase activity
LKSHGHSASSFRKTVDFGTNMMFPLLYIVWLLFKNYEREKIEHISVPMIIHGFSKNEQTAKQLLDNGFSFLLGNTY